MERDLLKLSQDTSEEDMEDMGMEGMVDTVDMEDMDTMERDLLKLSQDTSEEDMEATVMAVDMVAMVTAVVTMAREKLMLKLMLSQATFPEDMDMEDMDTEVMVAMDMDV